MAQNHPNEISVSAKLLAVNKIAVDMCGHCNKTCEASGANGEAFQCDLCEGWFHASCENVSSKHYKSFSTLAKSIPNMAYYCKHNKCQSRIKHIVAEFTRSSVLGSSQILDKLRDEQEEINNSLSDKYESLAQSVKELSSKIDSLVSRNCTLQIEIDSATEPPSASNMLASSGPSTSISPTLTILDELADRERRSKNLILYNFSESSDTKSEQPRVQELFSTVFNVKVQSTRTVRLGRRNDSKARPLLVCFEDAVVRGKILSQSGRLRKHEQFKNTYISPDRTKLEREKHQKLVTELKRRRSNGEQNLVIRNNTIVTITRRSQPFNNTDSGNQSS